MDNTENSMASQKVDAIIVYMDICGFTRYIQQNESKSGEVLSFIGTLLYNSTKDVNKEGNSNISFQQFSDSIFLSCEYIENESNNVICYLMETVSLLQYCLFIEYGLCLRGGIHKGTLIKSTTVSGKGIVSAYKLESEIANWYRIVLSPEIVDILIQNDLKEFIYADRNDKLATLNFLPIAMNKNSDEIDKENILSLYRNAILRNVYNKDAESLYILQNAATNLHEFIEIEKNANRYYDLILYYDLICDLEDYDKLKIKPQFRSKYAITVINQFEECYRTYSSDKNHLLGNLDRLIEEYNKYPYHTNDQTIISKK